MGHPVHAICSDKSLIFWPFSSRSRKWTEQLQNPFGLLAHLFLQMRSANVIQLVARNAIDLLSLHSREAARCAFAGPYQPISTIP
jgi:hypothetical protein